MARVAAEVEVWREGEQDDELDWVGLSGIQLCPSSELTETSHAHRDVEDPIAPHVASLK